MLNVMISTHASLIEFLITDYCHCWTLELQPVRMTIYPLYLLFLLVPIFIRFEILIIGKLGKQLYTGFIKK